jgi:phage-related protein
MGFFNGLGSKLKGVWNNAKNKVIGGWNTITNNASRLGDSVRHIGNTIGTKIQDGKNWVYDRSKFLKNLSEASGLDGKINNVSDIFKNGGNLISSLSRGDLGGAKRDALNTLQNGGSLIGASSTAIDTGRRMINKAEEMGRRVQSGFNTGKEVLSEIDQGFNSSDGFTQKRQDNIASQSQNMLDRLKGLSTTTNRRPRLAVMKSQPLLK